MRKWYYKLILDYAENNLVSNAIINNYFEELSKANDKRSKDSIKMKIIESCDKLIKWCIYSIFNDDDRYMEEDLYMYGVEIILKVINKYDYTYNNNFYLYCVPRLISYLKRKIHILYDIPIEYINDVSCFMDECEFLNFGTIVDSSVNVEDDILSMLNNKYKREYLFILLDELTERERNVIIERYGLINGKNKTLEELAEKYLISQQRVSSYVANILVKLKYISNNLDNNNIAMDFIECCDKVFEQLISYLDLGLERDTILSFMNSAGYNWTIADLDYHILMLYKIRCFLADINSYNDKYISMRIKKEFNLNFSEDFIRKIKSDLDFVKTKKR